MLMLLVRDHILKATIFKFIYAGSHYFLLSLNPCIARSSLNRPLPCTQDPASITCPVFPPINLSVVFDHIKMSLKLLLWFLCLVFLSFALTFLNSYLLIFLHLPLNVGTAKCFVLDHHSLRPGDLILFLGIYYCLWADDSPIWTFSPHSPLSSGSIYIMSSGHFFLDYPPTNSSSHTSHLLPQNLFTNIPFQTAIQTVTQIRFIVHYPRLFSLPHPQISNVSQFYSLPLHPTAIIWSLLLSRLDNGSSLFHQLTPMAYRSTVLLHCSYPTVLKPEDDHFNPLLEMQWVLLLCGVKSRSSIWLCPWLQSHFQKPRGFSNIQFYMKEGERDPVKI